MTLLKRLQDQRDWVAQTKGQKHAYVKLTLTELCEIIDGLSRLDKSVGPNEKPLAELRANE